MCKTVASAILAVVSTMPASGATLKFTWNESAGQYYDCRLMHPCTLAGESRYHGAGPRPTPYSITFDVPEIDDKFYYRMHLDTMGGYFPDTIRDTVNQYGARLIDLDINFNGPTSPSSGYLEAGFDGHKRYVDIGITGHHDEYFSTNNEPGPDPHSSDKQTVDNLRRYVNGSTWFYDSQGYWTVSYRGEDHSFDLAPVPLPATAVLLITSIGGLLIQVRRKTIKS